VEVKIFPDSSGDDDTPSGQVRRELKCLQRKYPRLYSLVDATLEEIRKAKDLKKWKDTGYEEKLPGRSEPIHVLKIPPKGKHDGVFRIYFGKDPGAPETIWLFTAEHKHGKNKDDPDKIRKAEQIYREMFH
jgi:hypothetical protein